MENKIQFGTPIFATAASTTSAAAVVAGVAGTTLYITDVSGSSDLAGATLQVTNGSTVIWQERISNTTPYQHSFLQPLTCTVGNSATVTVTGTSASNANFSGFSITP